MREAAAGLGLEEGGLFPKWVSGRADHSALRMMEMCVFLWGGGDPAGSQGCSEGAGTITSTHLYSGLYLLGACPHGTPLMNMGIHTGSPLLGLKSCLVQHG